MDFEGRKAKTLTSMAAPWTDKSPKGSIDVPISPLLDVINLHPCFFTTSSCSGRISVLRQPCERPNFDSEEENKIPKKKSKKKAAGGGWIYVTHDPADPDALVNLLFEHSRHSKENEKLGAEGGTLVFRFEPLIIAVDCKDVASAQELVSTAIDCGFRESGITSSQKRVMVAIRCSIRLEVPLGQVGLIMVTPEYVHYLVGIANGKMEANRQRTDRFLHVLREKVLPASAKMITFSPQIVQASIIDERNALNIEAREDEICLDKPLVERFHSLSSDSNAFSCEDKEMPGMHGMSLSVVALTTVGEPMEKLLVWGHSASPLVCNGKKEVVVCGGFGGIGQHTRRNYTLLLNIQSGMLKQIDATESPSPRVGHTATCLKNNVYVIGGRGGPNQIFNDVWVLKANENRWELIKCAGSTFHPRHRHATAAVGSNIFVFGGLNNEVIYSCLIVLNTEAFEWSNVEGHGELPCARHSHSLVAYGPLLLLFGGFDGQKALSDFYSFDTRTYLWKRVKTVGRAPSPRFSHSMFIYKDFLGIIGGCPIVQHNEVLSFLDLFHYRWLSMPINSVDRGFWIRSSTSVIDDELIILGGGASCYAFGTKFNHPMKISLNFLNSVRDIFSSEQNEYAVHYSMEEHENSQVNESRLQTQSPVSESRFHANKSEYKSDVSHLALQIKRNHAKLVKDILKKFGWLDLNKKVFKSLDGLHISIPVLGDFYDLYHENCIRSNFKSSDLLCKEKVEFSVNKISISQGLEILSSCNASLVIGDVNCDKKLPRSPQKLMREMICSLLTEKGFPKELLKQLPVRWERLGDIVVLPVTSFRDPRWDSIAKDLWPVVAKSLGALRLARQGRILPNGTRDSTLEILVGDEGWVTHEENGIIYSFDTTKCMFSSGNHSEKIRMANLDCSNEVIVDLFAGIGYFVLPFLVKAKAKLVYACEWNQHAVKALKLNVNANSVADQCIILEGDNRVTAPRTVADRVCLGLLPSSECSWRTAVRALRPQGGVLHVHESVEDSEVKQWLDYTVKSIVDIAKSEGLVWNVLVQHVERVKSYAPRIHHLVVDLRCRAL